MMRSVTTAYGRALRAQFTARMLLLSFVPVLLSLVVWGVLLYNGLQPLYDYLHALFSKYSFFDTAGRVLSMLHLGFLKPVLAPLAALLLLFPLLIITSMLFTNLVAESAIVRHVERVRFPKLERKQGGTFLGSVAVNVSAIATFAVLWIVTLPLYMLPPVAVLVQTVLWARLTGKVICYDALADHASAEEYQALIQAHRRPLMTIGLVSGLLGALPGLVWLSGALTIFLFPLLAIVSVWLNVMIFMFTGLWFQFYCMQALEDLRAGSAIGAGGAVQGHGAHA